MNKLAVILLSIILSILVGLGGCVTIVPPAETAPARDEVPQSYTPTSMPVPPEVPRKVISIWKSEPASLASTADIQDKITLIPNTAGGDTQVSENLSLGVIPAGTWQDSTSFYLEEGQWVDVIVSSLDIPIYFNWEEPGAVSLDASCWTWYEGKKVGTTILSQMLQPVGQPPSRDMGVFDPFQGKPLYENFATSTEEGTVFTTAGRVFASEGATEYWFTFTNWNNQKNADITCSVYMLDVTPGWGKSMLDTKLQPWLNELYYLLVSGEITEEEYDKAESGWLEQFK